MSSAPRSGAPLLPALLAATLAGCGQPNLDELQGYVERVKARPPQPLEPIPEVPQVDTFVYEPGNRRDPFVMDDRTAQATMPQQSTGVAPDPLRRREELEQYSLDALRMVGTLEQNDTRWGLIMSPDGVLHRVRVGNYLGQNNGQITQISPEGIALTEIVGEGPGSWREREASISLRQQ
ncbi:pilus assembly protein PilP [uncultured Thiohalocapsa sp.]|uniref:pilus assembly protein PilP n=1 Tax=uncultured Thiohalocapsa sp. TaxID=768990 RepID=UPI0025F32419|nr:pilus assembly protein PilP [uncultured Thiohalocapsa sp.]